MSRAHHSFQSREGSVVQIDVCGSGSEGLCSMHLDLSGYRIDEVPDELRQEGYGGTGLSGSDDYEMPRWY